MFAHYNQSELELLWGDDSLDWLDWVRENRDQTNALLETVHSVPHSLNISLKPWEERAKLKSL